MQAVVISSRTRIFGFLSQLAEFLHNFKAPSPFSAIKLLYVKEKPNFIRYLSIIPILGIVPEVTFRHIEESGCCGILDTRHIGK